jgi:hypothetical protein
VYSSHSAVPEPSTIALLLSVMWFGAALALILNRKTRIAGVALLVAPLMLLPIGIAVWWFKAGEPVPSHAEWRSPPQVSRTEVDSGYVEVDKARDMADSVEPAPSDYDYDTAAEAPNRPNMATTTTHVSFTFLLLALPLLAGVALLTALLSFPKTRGAGVALLVVGAVLAAPLLAFWLFMSIRVESESRMQSAIVASNADHAVRFDTRPRATARVVIPGSHENVSAELVAKGEPERAKAPWVLLYSRMEGRFVDRDAQGNPKPFHYDGNRLKLLGRVSDIHLAKNSPSIALENSVVHFQLPSDVSVPTRAGCHALELRFDEHALKGPFNKGDVWEITVTERGQLVDLRRASATNTAESSKPSEKAAAGVVEATGRALVQAITSDKKSSDTKKADVKKPEAERPSQPAKNAPDWVSAPPQVVGDAYRMAIVVGPWKNRQECDIDLPKELQKALDRYAELCLSEPAGARVALPYSFLRQEIVKDQWEEEIWSDSLNRKMTQLHVLLQFDSKVKDRIVEERQRGIVTSRLWMGAAGLAAVLWLLAVIYGYLRLDLTTGGAYRGRLRFAAALAILGPVAAALLAVA